MSAARSRGSRRADRQPGTSGREIDAELSYGTPLARGWLGGNLFARRQPGLFFGAAVAAGFLAMRFMKSSSQAEATRPSDDIPF